MHWFSSNFSKTHLSCRAELQGWCGLKVRIYKTTVCSNSFPHILVDNYFSFFLKKIKKAFTSRDFFSLKRNRCIWLIGEILQFYRGRLTVFRVKCKTSFFFLSCLLFLYNSVVRCRKEVTSLTLRFTAADLEPQRKWHYTQENISDEIRNVILERREIFLHRKVKNLLFLHLCLEVLGIFFNTLLQLNASCVPRYLKESSFLGSVWSDCNLYF